MHTFTVCNGDENPGSTPHSPSPLMTMRCVMTMIRAGRVRVRTVLVGALLLSATATSANAQSVGEYQGTTFVHGIASSGMMWEVPYAPLANQSVQRFLLSTVRIDLRTVRAPETDPYLLEDATKGNLRFPQQVVSLRDSIALRNDRSVLVAHSLGGIISRDVYISHPELRPHIAGIVTVATPHQGADIANYRVPLNLFFTDLQLSVNAGIDAARLPVVLIGLFGGPIAFAAAGVVGSLVFSWFFSGMTGAKLGLFAGMAAAILTTAYKLDGDGIPNLRQLSGITQLNVLKDMAPDKPEYYGNADLDFSHIRRLNTRTDDAEVARASVIADWGNYRHAAIRLFKSQKNEESSTQDLIDKRNQARALMNMCRHANRFVFRKRDARRCHRAQNMFDAVDEVWARSITGEVTTTMTLSILGVSRTFPVKRPRYGRWDGVVPNDQQRYPGLTDPRRILVVSGLNHVNVYKHDRGTRMIGAAMLEIGMDPVVPPPPPPPPPAPFTVSISGRSAVEPLQECAFSASVSGGTPPYAYAWTPLGPTNRSMVTLGNDGTAFDVAVTVTDSSGRAASASRTVTISSTAGPCPVAL